MDFESLYEDYSTEVLRFAFYLSGESAEAEDITSVTFVRAWSGRAKIRTATLKAYLFTIARNIYLEDLRKNKKTAVLEDIHVDPSPGPDSLVESRIELAWVQRFLGSLPECDRAAFIMRVQHSIPYGDIANSLGISLSSAKVKVHRTRKRLIAFRLDKETE